MNSQAVLSTKKHRFIRYSDKPASRSFAEVKFLHLIGLHFIRS